MFVYRLLYLSSLITFTFGALTFSVLTLFYWRERRLRHSPGRGRAFPVFTVLCAVAFVMNLMLRFASARRPDSAFTNILTAVLDLATGLLPALLFHLIYAEEKCGLAVRRFWSGLLVAFYAIGLVAAAAQALSDTGLAASGWGDSLDSARATMLGTAGALGLLVQFFSRRAVTPAELRHRRWMRVLLCAALLLAAANLTVANPFVGVLPDYLVLGFFCVTLYYKERLVFFDLLIKRGAFFALALVGMTIFFATAPRFLERLPADWSRPWIGALLLTPLWLLAPWAYGRLESGIDRVWLRRRYSAADAERRFVRDVQVSSTEEDLRVRAEGSLNGIFQAPAEVRFGAGAVPDQPGGLTHELEQQGSPLGWVALNARPSGIPFMSDDRRLLQSLARTLGVVLENVRFRQRQQEQEEREQQLRWLASRAELKALRAQINPHFLFNALNAIAGLIPGEPGLAEETVEQLAEVFRYTLRKSEKEWVRLDEEVEFVAAYLRVEKARFGERLRVEFQVEPGAGATPVPAMSIQPLVENAIKHGASTVEGQGWIRVQAELKEGRLRVEVLDNGPGFPPDFSLAASPVAPAGHGLRNVAERLKGYYGDSAELAWKSGPEGTRVFLNIPDMPAPDLAGSAAWSADAARSHRR
jgi:signal transduction histidine kinase